jgi:hypothetical protein
MTKTECKKIMFEYLEKELLPFGFKQSKKEWNGYRKVTAEGYIDLMFDILNSGEGYACGFTSFLFINRVEEIFRQVNEIHTIDPAYEYSYRATFWGNGLNLSIEELYASPYAARVTTEEEMREFLWSYKEDLLTISLPLFEGFLADLHKVDAIINGEDYWKNYWEEQPGKEYHFGVGINFYCRRIIIAQLCRNERLELFKEMHLTFFQENLIKYPESQKFIDALEYLYYILKDVKPLD